MPWFGVDAQACDQAAVGDRDAAVSTGAYLGVGDAADHRARPERGAIRASEQGKVGDAQVGKRPARTAPAGHKFPPSFLREVRDKRRFLVVERFPSLAQRGLVRDDARLSKEGRQTGRKRSRGWHGGLSGRAG